MQEKIVFITGCSSGIGESLALEFASRGCKVYASARKVESMESLPESVTRIQLDVVSKKGCEEAIAEVLALEGGRIDILVNNAGAGAVGPCCEFDIEQAKAVYETNVFAPMRLVSLVVPAMAKRGDGLIINIGSIVGIIPTPWANIYANTKAAIHSFSDGLRMEVKGFGIKVLLVAPGAITSKFGEKQSASFTVKENTLYKSAAASIEARAQMSQRADHSTPSATLARGIVDRALNYKNPTYYSAGGQSWTFWFLSCLPTWIVQSILTKKLGCDLVKYEE